MQSRGGGGRLAAQRTDRCIVQALLVLLRTNEYDQITACQIAAKAGVNRSSYYRRFGSKDAVVRRYYEGLLAELHDEAAGAGPLSTVDYLERMFLFFLDRRDNMLLLHQRGLSHLLHQSLAAAFAAASRAESFEERFAVAYHAGGVFGSFELWLDEGMERPPAQMARLAASALPAGFSPMLMR